MHFKGELHTTVFKYGQRFPTTRQASVGHYWFQSDLSFGDFRKGINATPLTADTAVHVFEKAVPATQPTPPTTEAALL